MTTATQNGNGKATANTSALVILSPEMTIQEAMGYVANGKVPVEAFLEWDADRVKRIEAKARGGNGNVKAFKISSSAKGVITITLPGMAMPIAPPVEAVECLLEHVEEIKAFLKVNGEPLKALRANYKTSPEYLATVAKMRADSAARKAS